jgi:hypothetical protein
MLDTLSSYPKGNSDRDEVPFHPTLQPANPLHRVASMNAVCKPTHTPEERENKKKNCLSLHKTSQVHQRYAFRFLTQEIQSKKQCMHCTTKVTRTDIAHISKISSHSEKQKARCMGSRADSNAQTLIPMLTHTHTARVFIKSCLKLSLE